ncbi:unnamed protein product [Prunus armeniaca]
MGETFCLLKLGKRGEGRKGEGERGGIDGRGGKNSGFLPPPSENAVVDVMDNNPSNFQDVIGAAEILVVPTMEDCHQTTEIKEDNVNVKM